MGAEIQHLEDEKLFKVVLDNKESVVKYRLPDAGSMDIFSTYVPPEHRGQGMAARLTAAALDYARSRELKVIPSCPYTRTYMQRNPSYQDLLKSTEV